MKKSYILCAICLNLSLVSITFAQNNRRPILTSFNFLRINPDARSAGLGNAGVATPAATSAIFWNPAKVVFNNSSLRLAATYVPRHNNIGHNTYLSSLAGYHKPGEKQALSFGVQLFNLGTLTLIDNQGNASAINHKNMAFSMAYSRKLHRHLSIGITTKFIREHVTTNTFGLNSSNTGAIDLGVFYNKPVKIGGKEVVWNWGASLMNFGPKARSIYSAGSEFIPTTLRLGTGVSTRFSQVHQLTWTLDINKLLVPSPNSQGFPQNKTLIQGIVGSLNDAPGGLSEEFQELIWSTGLEYQWKQRISLRTGYYYEHPTKGDRAYLTIGAGVKFGKLHVNTAYLFNKEKLNVPTEKFRIALGFSS